MKFAREMTPFSPSSTRIVMLDALEPGGDLESGAVLEPGRDLEPSRQRPRSVRGGAVSIGNFDGVHVGHRELLSRTLANADAVGGPAIAVVLDPHPASVLRPHSAPARLTTIERRAELMSDVGIDFLVVCPIDLKFLDRTAEEFFQFLISDRLRARTMVEGPNFFFGRDRGGNVSVLADLCRRANMDLEIVEPRIEEGRMVSSSRIREAIAAGRIEAANEMLQSSYEITGTVIRGEGRGRTIGFPTANLSGIDTLLPGHGVYAARAFVADAASQQGETGKSIAIPAAVHVGPNPTFDDQQRTKVEVHCLDYDADLYGRRLTVQWIARIREITKFDSAESLVDQLRRDVESVRKLIH